MNKKIVTFLMLTAIATTAFWACNNEKKQIEEELIKLEEAYAADKTQENAGAIVTKLNEFITKFPKESSINARYSFRAGELFFEQKDYNKAIEVLQSGIDNFKNEDATPKSYKLLGDIYRLRGNTTEAIITYSTLTREFPNHAAAKEAATAIPDNTALKERIGNLQKSIADTSQISIERSLKRELARNLYQYAMLNVDSSDAPIKLMEAGRKYGEVQDFVNAEKSFKMFTNTYDKHPLRAEAFFQQGILNQIMVDYYPNEKEKLLAEAEKNYKKVSQDYPESQFAKPARDAIKFLGQTLDEMLDQVMKNKQK